MERWRGLGSGRPSLLFPLPQHALGLLLAATEGLLNQQLSVVEWAVQWECCARDLESAEWPSAPEARQCLGRLKDFAVTGGLSNLDRGFAELRDLTTQWDHWWWVAERSGSAWPAPRRALETLRVTRQAGRSRISWHCPVCDWSLSWDVETAAWQVLDWPGVLECPLCATASNDDLLAGGSPPSECDP